MNNSPVTSIANLSQSDFDRQKYHPQLYSFRLCTYSYVAMCITGTKGDDIIIELLIRYFLQKYNYAVNMEVYIHIYTRLYSYVIAFPNNLYVAIAISYIYNLC